MFVCLFVCLLLVIQSLPTLQAKTGILLTFDPKTNHIVKEEEIDVKVKKSNMNEWKQTWMNAWTKTSMHEEKQTWMNKQNTNIS